MKIWLPPFFLLFGLMIWGAYPVTGQNLVPNPNFENYTSCPTNISQLDLAVPWDTPTMGTPDYFHVCTSNIAIDVPTNYGGGGYQMALTGNAYVGSFFRGSNNYREYIQVELLSPLEAGVCYHIGFFMNLMNQYCGTNQVGIYISADAPTSTGSMVLPVEPQIEGNGGFYSDTVAWVEIDGVYPASGGERYITIGNFKMDAESPFDPSCPNPPIISFYYIDSVYVFEIGPVEELPLDLGPEVETCTEYEIDGESGDVMYTWSDGSHGHTLIVNSTDYYALTITSGCAVGIDSVEVIFIGSPDVMIDPGFVSICEGETYTVTLDPNAGDYLWNDGSTESQYEITQAGMYSVTLDDGCDLTWDNITIEVMPLPLPFDLGDDVILCEGDEFEIYLDPGTDNVMWQDGQTESTYLISQPGIYSVTISNACGEVTDQIEVIGMQAPQADLGPDTLLWCEGDVIHYDFDPAMGDFLWNDDSTNPSYFIFTSGVYSLAITNMCGVSQDTVTVYEASLPNVEIGDTLELCSAAFPYTLSLQETSPGIDILWSTGETTSQIVVSNPGEYAVTVSNDCYIASDTAYLNVLAAPVVNLPDAEVICLGDTLLLDLGDPSLNYLWQDGSTLTSYEVTAPGWYYVTATNACEATYDSVIVTNFPSLIPPDLGPDITLCSGEQVTLSTGVDNVSYLWNDLSTSDTLLVTSSGTYSVTIEDQCATASDTVEISFSSLPPDVDLPSSLSLCEGQSILLDANISGVNYLWSDGTTNSSLNITIPGTYSLTVSNNCGSDMDTVAVLDGGTYPSIDLGDDIQLCPGESQIIAPDFTNADSWMWQNGSTDPVFVVDAPGSISIEVSNGCGSVYDTLLVAMLAGVPPFNLGNDTALCSSELLVLEINIPDVSITWFDGSHGDQVTVTGDGMYTAEIVNACGLSTDTIVVGLLPDIPSLSLGPDQVLCPGEMITFAPGIPSVQYVWQDGSTASSYTTTQVGLVWLTISNACGSATDSLVITESTDGPQLDLGPDLVACHGDVVTIQAGVAGVAYMWQDGSTNSFFQTAMSGEYSLHISNACGEDMDTVAVQFNAPPAPFSLGPDTVICAGESIVLNAPVTMDQLLWQDGSQGSSIVANAEQIYSLEISNACGVEQDDVVVLFDDQIPILEFDPMAICPGQVLILDASQSFDAVYAWNTGSTNASISIDAPGAYAVTVMTDCYVVSEVIPVEFDEACKPEVHYFIPNVFSPNRDGVNDVFTIQFNADAEVISIAGAIFDRWGNQVFGSDQIPFIWDGTFDQKPLNPGVYVYRFTLVYSNGFEVVTEQRVGDVTLMR